MSARVGGRTAGAGVAIKFCGLTRPEDTAHVVALGAAYAGVVLAGGPRTLDPGDIARVLAPVVGTATRGVAVLGAEAHDAALRMEAIAAVRVLQLHHAPSPDLVRRLKARFAGEVWAVIGIPATTAASALAERPQGASGDPVEAPAFPALSQELAEVADALVLDAAVGGRVGGTGTPFDWASVAPAVAALRAGGRRVVVAGGLRPANVAEAVRLLAPDVVDVSSGVEASVGRKDHEAMRAFAAAVRGGAA